MSVIDYIPVSDMSGDTKVTFSFIVNPTVNNNRYHYWLYIDIPVGNIFFKYALVDYEYPA